MTRPDLPAGKGGAVAPPDPWDPLIRITHWGVALAILANGLINMGGSVAVESRALRRNLVRPMVTGRRNREADREA
jgi:cytochrome b